MVKAEHFPACLERILIEAVSAETLEEVLPLIRQYQEFYKVKNISDVRNRKFFSQFGEANPQGCLFLFRHEGKAIAFATVYFTFASSIAAKVCIMNDLYTIPEKRGQGIGRQLIAHCSEYAGKEGAARLQWMTAPDNTQAQELYDSTGASKSTWHLYTCST